MTKGYTRRETSVILQKLAKGFIDFCQAEKELFALIEKLFTQDTYNYYQCHKCEDCECEPPQN